MPAHSNTAARTAINPAAPVASGDAPDWWRDAVIYQIYPRSFFDRRGDGVGDLRGICERLDYVAGLGVDAVWISPFFASPMADFGYDVSDYRAVEPMFGSLDDFDALVRRAHDLGLKVIIDQVINHSSDQHPWFVESRQSRDNPRADWYVWADPKEDGSPPNNWLAVFGGSAWQWEARRCQYYLHNFLVSQPDLNYHHPDVQRQMLEEMRFWLERGVDGFRLDAICYLFHDSRLRDNPAKPAGERVGQGFQLTNPYAFQRHIYDMGRPENLDFLGRIRGLMDEYPQRCTLGEISCEEPLAAIAEYTAAGRLNLGYSFALLADDFSTLGIRAAVEELEAKGGGGGGCWSIGNHDVARVLSRWGGAGADPALATVFSGMLFSLRGAVCAYQGEELGLEEAVVPLERIQDPYGKAFWPLFAGRDGCRTPMPWRAEAPHAGFSEGEPWLPIAAGHRACAVDIQEGEADSPLHRYRRFLRWRKGQPALRYGSIRFLEAAEGSLALVREYRGQRVLGVFHFRAGAGCVEYPAGWTLRALGGHGLPDCARVAAGRLDLAGVGGGFWEVVE